MEPSGDVLPVTTGERIMAAALIVLALGVLFIGADIMTGGRLTGFDKALRDAARKDDDGDRKP